MLGSWLGGFVTNLRSKKLTVEAGRLVVGVLAVAAAEAGKVSAGGTMEADMTIVRAFLHFVFASDAVEIFGTSTVLEVGVRGVE